jgi:hypothetical protein
LGSRVSPRPPTSPQIGDVGKRPPGVPPSRGCGKRGGCDPHPEGRVPVEHYVFDVILHIYTLTCNRNQQTCIFGL